MKIRMIPGADTAQAEGDWRYQCPFLALTGGANVSVDTSVGGG